LASVTARRTSFLQALIRSNFLHSFLPGLGKVQSEMVQTEIRHKSLIYAGYRIFLKMIQQSFASHHQVLARITDH